MFLSQVHLFVVNWQEIKLFFSTVASVLLSPLTFQNGILYALAPTMVAIFSCVTVFATMTSGLQKASKYLATKNRRDSISFLYFIFVLLEKLFNVFPFPTLSNSQFF